MPTKILSAALVGLEAELIEVEADSGGGDFGQIAIVGLPDTSVSEAKERVKSALRNCGCEYPKRKITVNLAPTNIKKHGSVYDLPIAVSILSLTNKFFLDFKKTIITGELSLSGDVRPINGILAIAMKAKKEGIKNLFIPEENAQEAKLIADLNIFPVSNLRQLITFLKNKQINFLTEKISAEQKIINKNKLIDKAPRDTINNAYKNINFSLIKGQEKAKRALEIAAAGGHNVLLVGPPGSGKTLLAQAFPELLPKLTAEEKLEVTNIHSISGKLKNNSSLTNVRPFRAPHHSASGISLIGGGAYPRPGEISLAHRGVLFLDEFPEFNRTALENLRQPLEDKVITISRAGGILCFPCNFILIAAMNPCPCGYHGDKKISCHCREQQILNYRRRISGPIMDRIDLCVNVSRISFDKLNNTKQGEDLESIKLRIEKARQIQTTRFKNLPFTTNSDMTSEATQNFCQLDNQSKTLMKEAISKMNLSPRSYFRILKIARTIADLSESEKILASHLAEALQYKPTAGQ